MNKYKTFNIFLDSITNPSNKYLIDGIRDASNLLEMAYGGRVGLDRAGDSENYDLLRFSSLADKKERFVLDTSDLRVNYDKFNNTTKTYKNDVGETVVDEILTFYGKLGDVVESPTLFKYYDGLKDLDLVALISPRQGGGYFQREWTTKKNTWGGTSRVAPHIKATGKTKEKFEATLVHEIQHYIQYIEDTLGGFDNNSSIADLDNDDMAELKNLVKKGRRLVADMARSVPEGKEEMRLKAMASPEYKKLEDRFNEIILQYFSDLDQANDYGHSFGRYTQWDEAFKSNFLNYWRVYGEIEAREAARMFINKRFDIATPLSNIHISRVITDPDEMKAKIFKDKAKKVTLSRAKDKGSVVAFSVNDYRRSVVVGKWEFKLENERNISGTGTYLIVLPNNSIFIGDYNNFRLRRQIIIPDRDGVHYVRPSIGAEPFGVKIPAIVNDISDIQERDDISIYYAYALKIAGRHQLVNVKITANN